MPFTLATPAKAGGANPRHYQAEFQTIISEKLFGVVRQQRRMTDLCGGPCVDPVGHDKPGVL